MLEKGNAVFTLMSLVLGEGCCWVLFFLGAFRLVSCCDCGGLSGVHTILSDHFLAFAGAGVRAEEKRPSYTSATSLFHCLSTIACRKFQSCLRSR